MSAVLTSQLPLPDTFEACYLEYNRILPLETTETHVRVAVSGDPDPDVLEHLCREFGRPVEVVPVSEEELTNGIRRAYAAAESIVEVVNDLRSDEGASVDDHELADARDLASQPPVVKYVNLLIKEAHDARASDIHLESTARGLRARFRVDGVHASRSEEHTSELQSLRHLVCRLLLEKKKKQMNDEYTVRA